MSAERAPSFVDTNVLVYAFEKGSSRKKEIAKKLVNDLMSDDLLCVSTQVLQELFVTLTRKVSHPCSGNEALAVLDDLSAWPVTVIDYAAIATAVKLSGSDKLSFWDSLVVVAASRTGASVLYTEDLNHGQLILGVRVSNPFLAEKPIN